MVRRLGINSITIAELPTSYPFFISKRPTATPSPPVLMEELGEGCLQADRARQSNRLLRLLPQENHTAMLGTTGPWQSRLGH